MPKGDDELVSAIVATRDAASFELLVNRHHSRVRNWLRQLSNDAALADDLAQEVFIIAWRRISSFRGTGTFSGWLMKIAYNAFLQAERQQKRERAINEQIFREYDPIYPEDTDRLADVIRLLSVLTQQERVVMILCYAHEYSHAEICQIVDMPLGTVKSHIRRGRLKILDRFKPETKP
jgi:RNA polymerase sigma-70 factor (ECF subfamily)